MKLIELVVFGFAGLSAVVWLIALAVNVGVSLFRWASDEPVKASTTRVVGIVAGLMVFFSTSTVWPDRSVWWLALVVLPDLVAILSDSVYYRKHPHNPPKASDNPDV